MEESLQRMVLMYMRGTPLLPSHVCRLLRGLRFKGDLAHVRSLHSIVSSMEIAPLAIIADHLISFFVFNESFLEASLVFCRVLEPSIRTYHAVISGHARHGDVARSLELYHRMLKEGFQPNEFTFPCILKACGNIGAIEEGQLLHNEIISSGLEPDVVIGNTLIDMYTKCGSLDMARKVFDELSNRSLVSWSAMIAGYTQHGHGLLALKLFQEMQQAKIQPDMVTFSCVLKTCSILGVLEHGKLIHDQIIKSGITLDVVVRNTLIDMYAKCGRLEDACNVFDKLLTPNMLSWGAMIAGYVQNGQDLLALKVLEKMQNEGFQLDKVMYLCTLKACGGLGAFKHGKLIHNQIIRSNLDSDVVIRNALIDMYARCGMLDEGCGIFNKSGNRDAVSWVTMMASHSENGLGLSALVLFEKMQQQGIQADTASLSCVLKACGQVEASQEGRLIHNQILSSGSLELDLVLGNSLIDMYAKCRCLKEARNVFDRLQSRDVVSCGAMMAGYAQHGHGFLVIELFEKMQKDHIKPDAYVFSCTLKACRTIGALSEGKWVHNQLVGSGLKLDAVIGSSLVDMYAKCGDLEEAYKVFGDLEQQDISSWGAIIAGCVLQGNGSLALNLYGEMQQKGVETNEFIMSSILKACGTIGATCQGKLVHDQIVRNELESDAFVENALVDMYVKCGSTKEAFNVFKTSRNQSVVLWGALIAGYAQCGDSNLAAECFENMQLQGLVPDESIYASVLSACGHAGQVDKIYHYYNSMIENHGVTPSIKHYNCMADTYARTGYLKEAKQLLQSMPSPPDMYGQASLLCASSLHGNIDLRTRCVNQFFWLDANNDAG